MAKKNSFYIDLGHNNTKAKITKTCIICDICKKKCANVNGYRIHLAHKHPEYKDQSLLKVRTCGDIIGDIL